MSLDTASCAGCGYPAGRDACQSVFQDVSLRVRALAWTDSLKTWRLMHDVYNVQHAEELSGTYAKLVTHLGGICWALEHGGGERGYRALQLLVEKQSWEGEAYPPAPGLPQARGTVTAASLSKLGEAPLLIAGVDRWARATWMAFAGLQPLAREWVQQALALVPARR